MRESDKVTLSTYYPRRVEAVRRTDGIRVALTLSTKRQAANLRRETKL